MPDLSSIQNLIKDIHFPIKKDDLIKLAQEKGLPDMLINHIKGFGKDKFENADELKNHLGNVGNFNLGGIL